MQQLRRYWATICSTLCIFLIGGCTGYDFATCANSLHCSIPNEPDWVACVDPANKFWECNDYYVVPLDPLCSGYHSTVWTPWNCGASPGDTLDEIAPFTGQPDRSLSPTTPTKDQPSPEDIPAPMSSDATPHSTKSESQQ